MIKLGSGPFQYWVISLYNSLTYKIILFISIIPKIVYTYLLMIINSWILSWEHIYIFILISMITGGILGIPTLKIKKILASSSIYNLSFLLLSIYLNIFIINKPYNILDYLIFYIINSINLIWLLKKIKIKKDIRELILIFKIKPWISILILISIISLIGIPPLMGFFSKLYIIINSLLTLNSLVILLILISLITMVMSSIYYFYIIKYIYNDKGLRTLKYKSKEELYPNKRSYLISITSILIITPLIWQKYYIPIIEIIC
jgi:NADH:ubiquinone oxidoreductase subunit 2 (subunit N)